MASIVKALGDIVSSVFELIASLFQTAFNIVRGAVGAALGLVQGIINAALELVRGVLNALGGVGKFILGNFFVLAVLAAAFFGFLVYQRRQGKAVTVGNKKLN